MTTSRTCSVANGRCLAPAGVSNAMGWAECVESCRGTCVDCGEPVCSGPLCSRRLARGRVCFWCAGEPDEWIDELREKESTAP